MIKLTPKSCSTIEQSCIEKEDSQFLLEEARSLCAHTRLARNHEDSYRRRESNALHEEVRDVVSAGATSREWRQEDVEKGGYES